MPEMHAKIYATSHLSCETRPFLDNNVICAERQRVENFMTPGPFIPGRFDSNDAYKSGKPNNSSIVPTPLPRIYTSTRS